MPLEDLPSLDDPVSDVRAEAEQSLRENGAPTPHVGLLADVLAVAAAGQADGGTGYVEQEVRILGSLFRTHGSNIDAAMMDALLWFACPRRDVQVGPIHTQRSALSNLGQMKRILRLLPRWVDARPQIDLVAGLRSVPPHRRRVELDRCVLRTAARAGRLDLAGQIDLPALRAHTGGSSPDDPRGVWYWFLALGRDALSHILPLVERAADEDAGAIAYGVIHSLSLHLEHGMGSTQDQVASPNSAHVLKWIQHMESRLVARPDDLLLWATQWEFMRSDLTLELGDEVERRLLDATQRQLSRFRHGLGTGSVAADVAWSGHVEHYFRAFEAVQAVGGHWKAMKAALLLHRVLPVASVGDDLRHWPQSGDAPESEGGPPTHWRWVPGIAVGIANSWARDERPDDPDLRSMRETLARYFLDRLRSRLEDRSAKPGHDDDMVESSPHWRRACIQAVRALRVNPARTGHRVLHWLRANDPHEEIRQEAGVVHDEMVRGVTLAPGTSPLRAVKVALWWTRWASRRALGLSVDQAAANRTKQKEMRQTKEVEQLFDEQ